MPKIFMVGDEVQINPKYGVYKFARKYGAGLHQVIAVRNALPQCLCGATNRARIANPHQIIIEEMIEHADECPGPKRPEHPQLVTIQTKIGPTEFSGLWFC